MFDHPLAQRLQLELAARTNEGLERHFFPVQTRHGSYLMAQGQKLLDFSSNDFLGLGTDQTAANTLATLCSTKGCGAGASRLVTGTTESILAAEQALAQYFGFESCLILGSGFAANLTLISTLFSSKDILMLDKRVHASTMTGARLAGAKLYSFRHNSLAHLEKILRTHPACAVLTESLFSMDADSPDFATLAKLKARFNFLTLVDEAHALGVLGPKGRGLSQGTADIVVGTLGKAFGFFGAFILMPYVVREYLINFGQGFIYTTALPPWFGDMVIYLLSRVAQAHEERAHLAQLGQLARKQLGAAGFAVRGSAQILTVEVGDATYCQRLAHALRQDKILVFAARYPTVPLGQAMLRICLTSTHEPKDITRLQDALVKARSNL